MGCQLWHTQESFWVWAQLMREDVPEWSLIFKAFIMESNRCIVAPCDPWAWQCCLVAFAISTEKQYHKTHFFPCLPISIEWIFGVSWSRGFLVIRGVTHRLVGKIKYRVTDKKDWSWLHMCKNRCSINNPFSGNISWHYLAASVVQLCLNRMVFPALRNPLSQHFNQSRQPLTLRSAGAKRASICI